MSIYLSTGVAVAIRSYLSSPPPYKNPQHNLAALAVQLKCLKSDAWLLDEEECRHYVYVYLDPRRPGDYRYTCLSGKSVRFAHRPYYVGKGTSYRWTHHASEARRGRSGHKANVLKAIEAAGFDPLKYVTVTASRRTDWMAQALEIDLIAGIGRYDLGKGPLTNKTDGGESHTGVIHSASRLHKMSNSMKSSWAGKSVDEREAIANKVSSANIKAWRNKTAEDNEARRLKRKATESSRPKLVCPHCDMQHSRSGMMKTFHFDNCKFKGLPAEQIRVMVGGSVEERKVLMRERCKASAATRPQVKCPHCSKEGRGPVMHKWHFDNCKQRK